MEPIQSQTPATSLTAEELKAERGLKALQGTSIGFSSLGMITLLAIGIILAAAPLLIPVVISNAILIAGACVFILGVALSVAAIVKSFKTFSPLEKKLQSDVKELKKQETILLEQVKKVEVERNQAENENQEVKNKMQEIQANLDKNELELARYKELDLDKVVPQLDEQKDLVKQYKEKLDQTAESLQKEIIENGKLKEEFKAKEDGLNKKINDVLEQKDKELKTIKEEKKQASESFDKANQELFLVKQKLQENEEKNKQELSELTTEMSKKNSEFQHKESALNKQIEEKDESIKTLNETMGAITKKYQELADAMANTPETATKTRSNSTKTLPNTDVINVKNTSPKKNEDTTVEKI